MAGGGEEGVVVVGECAGEEEQEGCVEIEMV